MAGFDFADFDARQQRRFFVQIIRHRRQPRRDDAAGVIARAIHDIKRDRRSEIHDDHRRAKAFARRHRVCQPVRPDGIWLWIINAHAAQGFRREFKRVQLPMLANGFADERRGARHDAAQNCAVNFFRAGKFFYARGGVSAKPFARRNIDLPQHAPVVCQADVRVRVADVEKQNHRFIRRLRGFSQKKRSLGKICVHLRNPRIHFSSVTSPPVMRSRWPCSVRTSNAPSSSSDSARPRIFRPPI